jgi:hypothetical protein
LSLVGRNFIREHNEKKEHVAMTSQKPLVHTVQSVTFEADRLILKVDGRTYFCPLSSMAPRLHQASQEARLTYIGRCWTWSCPLTD